jgi:hypothetical protein
MSLKKIKILFIVSDDNNVFPRLYEKNRLPDASLMLYVIQENSVRYIMRELVNNET